jgi:hypothetical protein
LKSIAFLLVFFAFVLTIMNPAVAGVIEGCPRSVDEGPADFIARMELEGGSTYSSDRQMLIWTDEISRLKEHIEKKAIYDKKFSASELKACVALLAKYEKAVREGRLSEGRTNTGTSRTAQNPPPNRECSHLYIGKAVSWTAVGCAFDCQRSGKVTGIGRDEASVRVDRSGNVIEGACSAFK